MTRETHCPDKRRLPGAREAANAVAGRLDQRPLGRTLPGQGKLRTDLLVIDPTRASLLAR